MKRDKSLWLIIALFLWLVVRSGSGADWHTWRYDANRSAASPGNLPGELHLQWVRKLPPPQLAWPNESRLHFDASYQPVVVGKTLFLGSPNDGSVTAFDAETAEEKWKFYTEGPVRFAPVVWRGKVYLGSDDGYLYCLDAADGRLWWKVRGAPKDRKDWRHLGNARLISFWPVRGGPVLEDGTVYFAAGIWPTLGVFIAAVDAETGKVLWKNSGGNYIENVRIDHNTLHEAGLSPQGYLVVMGDKLVAPNGRSMPARLERKTGRLLYYVQGYRNGDCRVTATGKYIFVGNNGVLNINDGREVGSRWAEAGSDAPNSFDGRKADLFEGPLFQYKMFPGCNARSVLASGVAYGIHKGIFYAYDLEQSKVSLYSKEFSGHQIKPARWDAPVLWKLATEYTKGNPVTLALIKAGDRLYGHAGKTLIAVDLPANNGEPEVVWKQKIDDMPSSMLAADDKLFVVTQSGIYCFGGRAVKPITHPIETVPVPKVHDQWTQTAAEILKGAGISEGYCLVLGVGSGRLLEELLQQSELKVIGVSSDSEKVNALRRRLTAAGLYGKRAELFVGNPFQFYFPPYLASLIVSENQEGMRSQMSVKKLFNTLRPYGGAACFTMPTDKQKDFSKLVAAANLQNAEVERTGRYVLLRRVGALPRSAYWTHESADPARSYFSKDKLVRTPLAVLWYGDGDDYGFYKWKDYGTGVKPQVVGGRLFALQVFSHTLHAIDVYTGRLLWKKKVAPFTRYASMEDGIYVAGGDVCGIYDPATGAERARFQYKTGDENGRAPFVSDIRVSEDTILIAAAFKKVRVIEKGLWDSTVLVALDRKTGGQLWTKTAKDRFNNHAIAVGGGRVFCIDSVSPIETGRMTRKGEKTEQLPSRILALDSRTGGGEWEAVTTNTFRTYRIGHWLGMRANDDWLAYCKELKILLTGKNNQIHAFNAETGKEVWRKPIGGGQPLIVKGKTFMTQSGHVFDILSGERLSDKSLFMRGGCNYAVANEHLIFVRDHCASYVDVATGKKHYLRNLRSGCSNSLVAADGVLNAPCFSVRCVCNYPIQTSFAMVHVPEVEGWAGATPIKLNEDAD